MCEYAGSKNASWSVQRADIIFLFPLMWSKFMTLLVV